MSIKALPAPAVRALGASQVLTDPAAVIKELVDNALDARATSIAIEISSNTIDHIQLRDNGHGIPPEDRHLVARPHCTSKISSADDLTAIGGTSLGFRGEALASVAEMSGSLTVCTRVNKEQVAIALKIDRQGEVTAQERTSQPVGTTIKITDFIKSHPVRKQVALKNTEKCHRRIKHLLQSYAFARPHVRISLRVTKSKNTRGDWMYAPKPGGNAEDVAYKVVGAACASQCTWSVIEEGGLTLQAFLPRPDADVSKVANVGSFLSLDSRPVSSSRGTLKQIVKTFREALKGSNSALGGVKEPFLYLEISCPPGSHDVNVEPAKDDAVFGDPDVVISAARRLFGAVYSTQSHEHSSAGVAERPTAPPLEVDLLPDEDDFVTSLEQYTEQGQDEPGNLHAATVLKPDQSAERPSFETERYELNDHEVAHPRRVFRSNMYGFDEEDIELLDDQPAAAPIEEDLEEHRRIHKDISISNPWVTAKLNALRRPPPGMDDEAAVRDEIDAARVPSQSPRNRALPQIDLESPILPTPRPSSPPQSQTFHPSDHIPDFRLAGDARMIGSQSLPPPQAHLAPASHGRDSKVDGPIGQPNSRMTPAYDYSLATSSTGDLAGTPLSAVPDSSQKRRRSPRKNMHQTQINKPFVSPVKGPRQQENVWFDHLEGIEQRERRSPRKRQQPANDGTGLVLREELGDLTDDPRPLTPPRRNRDMRDFMTSTNLIVDNPTASFTAAPRDPRRQHSRKVEDVISVPDDVNDRASNAKLNNDGFMPASKLAGFEAHMEYSGKARSRPPKRRKTTSESNVLREIDGNARAAGDNHDLAIERQGGLRRRTTDGSRVRRTKSSQLLLERVPAGQRTHNLVYSMSTTKAMIPRSARQIDETRSLLGWNGTLDIAFHAFDPPHDSAELRDLTEKLEKLLVDRVSDSEMVQDLSGLIQNALIAHAEASVD